MLLPRLDGVELDWARPWVYAVLLLPVAMSLPWLYRKLDQWLDNFWLGRRFTTVEAVKSFLAGLQSATSEQGLVDDVSRAAKDHALAEASEHRLLFATAELK